MKKIYIRNAVIFVALILVFITWLAFTVISQTRAIRDSNAWVDHTYKVISYEQEWYSLVNSMLAAQRGYIITGNDYYREKYERYKADIVNYLDLVEDLTSDSKAQTQRIDKVQFLVARFVQLLDMRMLDGPIVAGQKAPIDDVQDIEDIRRQITRYNYEILENERELLARRVQTLKNINNNYILIFLVGGGIFALILLFFNSYILKSQFQRLAIMEELQETTERLDLALEGMNDGIFDWDMQTGHVFYSDKFKALLGYQKDDYFAPTIEQFNEMMHPDDVDATWIVINAYLHGDLSEYSSIFRMKNRKGYWIWVNSRAKAKFDKNGKSIRFTGAISDITDMRDTEARLIEATQNAMRANEAKSEFLAHMSHEIRTPLTSISGIAEILEKQGEAFTEKQMKLIRTLSRSASALKDLINDVLDFSKIEANELTIDSELYEPHELLTHIKQMMDIKAEEKSLDLIFDIAEIEGKLIEGDAARLRQIVVNLVGNAIKFTDQGFVKLTAALDEMESGGILRLSVQDSGIGIDAETQEVIFDKFKQADSSISRKYGGTGLGLPISRRLARMMGGDITVTSTIGEGSTFTVTIASNVLNIDQSGEDVSKLVVSAQSDYRFKALIAEDYEASVIVFGHILNEMDVDYDHVFNGKEAVDTIAKNHDAYDFILMDVQMPEMDGLQATLKIREFEKENHLKAIPIMGLTAHALTSERNKCFKVGMNEFMTKPIDEPEFKKKIIEFLKKDEAPKKKRARS